MRILKKGGDLLSHKLAVPLAQSDLTSLFEMGRGEPRRNNHLKSMVVCFWLSGFGFLCQPATINYQPRPWPQIS